MKLTKNHRPQQNSRLSACGLVWFGLLLPLSGCQAQQGYVGFDPPIVYGFENQDYNFILGPAALENVFEKLYQQKIGGNQIVRILHIGDSHIQADFCTEVIRENLQLQFGNAGRGLMVPLRVAKTNEPKSYRTEGSPDWQAQRCARPPHLLPIGIGGVTVSCAAPEAELSVKTANHPLLDYSFNKLTVFYQKNEQSYDLSVLDSNATELGLSVALREEMYPNTATFQLPFSTNQVRLRAATSRPGDQNQLTIFGLSAENGQTGVLYHTVGVNGAMGSHYAQSAYFAEQTRALEPDLIIISLGTNEAQDTRLTATAMRDYLAPFVAQLRANNPQAAFLFTTPASSYYKRTQNNTRVAIAAEGIVQLALEQNAAYWDLNKVGGSAALWRKHALLSLDGVHYTPEGYALQGNLFCDAFFNAYNSYVSNRH